MKATFRSLPRLVAWFLCLTALVIARVGRAADVDFDQYFVDKAIRVELHVSGDAREAVVMLRDLYEEPTWPENPKQLIAPFEYGKFAIKVYDAQSDKLIYYKGFDSLYSEYLTTDPARAGVKRSFETTTRCPMPKQKVKVKIERRDREHNLSPVLEFDVDPKSYQVRRESVALGDVCFDIQNTGPAQSRVDLVFLAEGYTAEQEKKFRSDAERMTKFLFTAAPYRDAKDRFNVRGVFRASAESGTDQPRQKSFKSTALNSTYNIFDLDRYMLVEDNHLIHRMAAQVPHDVIVVLVNIDRYGGGGMPLDYCTVSADDPFSPIVFVHEFGHTFGYLADEYIGNVAYNDLYPPGIEPLEPNITRELDPAKIKWKDLLSAGISLPTSPDVENVDKVVGAFEGGGYVKEGMFRPELRCWMNSLRAEEGLCVVCQAAVNRMIDYYTK